MCESNGDGVSEAQNRALQPSIESEGLNEDDIAALPTPIPSPEANRACLRLIMQRVFVPDAKYSNPLTPAEAQVAFVAATESQLIGMQTQEWTLACRAIDCTYKLRAVTGDGSVSAKVLGGTRQDMPCVAGEPA